MIKINVYIRKAIFGLFSRFNSSSTIHRSRFKFPAGFNLTASCRTGSAGNFLTAEG